MKNILMIATYFPPAGGVGTVRVTKYVKYLRKYGWNPTVVTIDETFITNYDNTLLKDIDRDIEVIRLKVNCKKYKKIEVAFYQALKQEISSILKKKNYDAIFITGGPFEPMKVAPYIYKKLKVPYVIDLRDPWKLQKINTSTKLIEIKSRIKKVFIGISEKKIFRYASTIYTVNDTMTKQYQEEYPTFKCKFITIPNGYDPDDYIGIVPKKMPNFCIMYAGKFEVSAGFRDPTNIFRAIKIVNEKGINIHFVHIGQEEKRVIEIAEKENVKQYCTFLGRKTYQDTLEYCKGANILLVIGGNEKSEQTGKIFDYIGCNHPILVLANEESEINSVCKKVKNAYCIRKDEIDKMVDIIVKLYNTKEDNLEEIVNEYTREKLTYDLVQTLNKIDKG